MQVSLYPYNYWCLIAAFVLLLVFLVMTFLKARPLIRQLNTMKPQLTEIQNGITASKIKADTIGTKAKKDVNQGSGVLSSLLILNAIRKDYRNADGISSPFHLLLPVIVIHLVQMLSGRTEIDISKDTDERNDHEFSEHRISPSGTVLSEFSIADQDAFCLAYCAKVIPCSCRETASSVPI